MLAVDWPSAGTRGPQFEYLASLLGDRYIVWRTSAGSGHTTWEATAEAYAGPWVQEVCDSSLKVRAVLACGVGGTLAAVISEMVEQRQGDFPKLLLIDPELVDADLIYQEFLALLPDGPLPVAAEKEVQRLRERGGELAAESGGDPAALAAQLYALMASVDELGAGGRTTARAEARLAALALAERTDVTRMWGKGTALCSTSSMRGLSRTRASLLLPEAELVGRELNFAVDHSEIFEDAAVARTVSELISA